MKIGIITFHSAHNYGAVLQAWASQEYLKQQGHEVHIINLRLDVIDKLYRLAKKPDNTLLSKAECQARFLKHKLAEPYKVEKYKKFEKFINKVLPVTAKYSTYEELKNAALEYDALITGSDQVWNGTMMKGISPAYFLNFANKDALRISYAASVGTDEIPGEYKKIFERYLRNIDYISVREKKAREEVMALTDKEVDLVADPTFLLKQEDFNKIKKDPKVSGKYIYVHNVHLKRVDEDLNSVAEEMSKRLGLPIIHNWASKVYENEAGHFTGGIEEFLGYVANAEFVITNSFHCTVFATIYQRNFITVPHFKHPDRMMNLLDELGIPEHLIYRGEDIPKDLSKLDIDYEKVEEKRAVMREHAQGFLKKALSGTKKSDNRKYLEYPDKFRCYGCGVCKAVCPEAAISMETDEEGFLYPVVDKEKCVKCGKCKSVCLHENAALVNAETDKLPILYAAYNKDEHVLENSTSGGVFTAMYKNILEKGGKVVGVRYDEDMNVMYDIAATEDECKKFRRMKYVAADSKDTIQQVKELLEKKETVLYAGTPCQLAALKSCLGKDYANLLLVEVSCAGAASPKVFKKYLEFLEEKHKSKVTDFMFVNKFKGADTPHIVVEFESGNIYVERAEENNYQSVVNANLIQRPQCYMCEYADKKAGVGDITIGTYTGIENEHPEFKNEKGTSFIKVNTEKGLRFFEECKADLEVFETTYDQVYAYSRPETVNVLGKRGCLMYNLDAYPIDDLLLTLNPNKTGGIKELK